MGTDVENALNSIRVQFADLRAKSSRQSDLIAKYEQMLTERPKPVPKYYALGFDVFLLHEGKLTKVANDESKQAAIDFAAELNRK